MRQRNAVESTGGATLRSIDARYFRPTEVDYLLADATKARRDLGWSPRINFRQLVQEMVEHDLELARQEQTLITAGLTSALEARCMIEQTSGAEPAMNPGSRMFVAGHRGLVGSAICRRLEQTGFTNVIVRSRSDLDLRNQQAVNDFLHEARPEYIFLAAAKVGGILANSTYPAEFIYDNLAMQTNLIHGAWKSGVRKLLFLGSSCVYPKITPQPIREDQLLTSALESTNEWYAVAKIAGIKPAQAYRRQYGFNAISAMPTNLYGPGNNFHPTNSHVIPALLRRFYEARKDGDKEVVIWGSGEPRREFLHADDVASAAVFLMRHYDGAGIINVGTGIDVTIRELAEIIRRVANFEGRITFDRTKPDGTPRKLLDVEKIERLGRRKSISREDGIAETYRWYCETRSES
jgi:GDP-L-fucose synthase